MGDDTDWRSLRLRAIGWTAAAMMGLSFWAVVALGAWALIH